MKKDDGLSISVVRRRGFPGARVMAPMLAVCALVSGCVTQSVKKPPPLNVSVEKSIPAQPIEADSFDPAAKDAGGERRRPWYLDVSKRMVLPPAGAEGGEKEGETVYSFRAQDMPVVDALALFAAAYGLNIVPDPDITGSITVDFENLPFGKAMEAILDVNGYYWEWDRGLVRVRKLRTKTFIIDYVRLIRGGSSTSQAQITSGESAETGRIAVNQEDRITFWEDIEKQIASMLSSDGKLVVNRMSGALQVTDTSQRIELISRFIEKLNSTIHRQVEIEAKIFEVTLNDESSLGVDWSRITLDGGLGAITTSNIITTPFGGAGAKAATVTMTYSRGDFDGIISALKEQGEIRVVSQPKIITLNNQTALIKVGTDRPFFETTTTPVPGAQPTITEEVRYVTIGVVLSITPQISADGWIIMDVSPIITRLVDTVTSVYGSTAPVVDVKQSSAMVRLRDNEMVVIGGLIQDETVETDRKVPLLGDIPGIGALFRGKYETKVRRELAMFIVPKIIRD